MLVNKKDGHILNALIENGIISSTDAESVWVNTIREKVQEVHKYAIFQCADGRWKTTIYVGDKRRPVSSVTELGLYEKLYNFYFFGDIETGNSLHKIFNRWRVWATTPNIIGITPISNCSYLEYCRVWQKFIAKSSIAKMSISKIKIFDLQDFIDNYKGLSKQDIGNIKTVFSHLYKQALRMRIDVHNIALDVQIQGNKCAQPDQSDNVFQLEDMNTLKQHMTELENPNMYDYAVQFALELPCRIGEIKALSWNDIQTDNTVYIHQQITSKQERKAVKGNTSKGNRYIPLTQTALGVLNEVKKLNLDSEYIFNIDGAPFRTDCFDRALKRHCKQAGIPYHSSHKIRFFNASLLYINDVPLKDIQYYLGHTTQAMTEHYLRDIISRHQRDCAKSQYLSALHGYGHTSDTSQIGNKKTPETDNIVQFRAFQLRGANQI